MTTINVKRKAIKLFLRFRRPRWFITASVIVLYTVFMVTHPDNTGPPPAILARPVKPLHTISPVPYHRPELTPIQVTYTVTPAPYNKALNDRVAAALKRSQTSTGYSNGYNTGGRRTTLEGDQGGSATREFSQQDGVTFLDDNTMSGGVSHIKPFGPPK